MLEDDDLDRIILVRHGMAVVDPDVCGEDHGLHSLGVEQITELATEDIKKIVGDDYYYILTSPEPRCVQTSDIINEALAYSFYGHHMIKPELGPNRVTNERSLKGIHSLIKNHRCRGKEQRGKKFRGAILVTHHHIIPPLTKFIGREYGFASEIPMDDIERGHAIYLDLKSKAYEMLPRNE